MKVVVKPQALCSAVTHKRVHSMWLCHKSPQAEQLEPPRPSAPLPQAGSADTAWLDPCSASRGGRPGLSSRLGLVWGGPRFLVHPGCQQHPVPPVAPPAASWRWPGPRVLSQPHGPSQTLTLPVSPFGGAHRTGRACPGKFPFDSVQVNRFETFTTSSKSLFLYKTT